MNADPISRVPGIKGMSDEEFLEFELEIVRLYRSDAEAQESVAVALTVANLIPSTDRITRARLDELFAMLQHVHDPFVTGSAQETQSHLRKYD